MCIRDSYSSLKNINLDQAVNEFSGKNFSDFKEKLIEVLVHKLEPISKEINKLMTDKDYLNNILNNGYEKADNIASKKVTKLKEIIGFY